MKFILLLLFSSISLFSSKIEMLKWKDSWTFLEFLQEEKLPATLYYEADYDDKKAIEDIQAKSRYFILRDDNGTLEQVLISLSEELQVHIYKSDGKYFLENIPIEYQIKESKFVVRVLGSSVYNDIQKQTSSHFLAGFFIKTMKERVNFKKDIHKNSIVAMIYNQKYRLGTPFGAIDLKVALLQTSNRKKYVIQYNGKNYNSKGEYIEKHTFIHPVEKGKYWISSKFTLKRWHPILKKYRAHLGTDYAAVRGTPIYSVGDGIVVTAYRSRSYGNVVKIKHKGGYLSLYAHMQYYKKGLKSGRKVKKGEFIGRVGTTGLSTGPHLHFGLYKNGIALDPEKILSVPVKSSISKIQDNEFLQLKNGYIEQINNLVKDFKSGIFKSEKYKKVKLYCETAITNIDEIDTIDNEDLYQEIQTDDFDDDELPLSEDYQEYNLN